MVAMNKNMWDDFLDPNKSESESLQRAWEFMSENSLPISFDHAGEDDGQENKPNGINNSEAAKNANSLALVGRNQAGSLFQAPSEEALANNPYMAVLSKIAPSELVSMTSCKHRQTYTTVNNQVELLQVSQNHGNEQ